jgi:mannose/fructose/N-acetylgalactosamine-specific phosphotransferase system component IIB
MITFFRIDERLIHGQIAIKWSKHTGVSHIVVANDAAAANPIIQKSLMMAAPSGIKTAIKTLKDAIELINDPRAQSLKILVLVNNPRDAVEIIEQVKDIPFINVGNYGRIAPDVPGKPRKAYGRNIYCNEMEVEEFRKLVATGLKCIYQTTPEEMAEDVSRIFK